MATKKSRPSWDEYFMEIARQVSTRATCDRKHVGAVIVRDKAILSTGYNGAPHHLPHCDEVGHEIVDGHCVRTTTPRQTPLRKRRKMALLLKMAIYTLLTCYDFLAYSQMHIKVVYGEFYPVATVHHNRF